MPGRNNLLLALALAGFTVGCRDPAKPMQPAAPGALALAAVSGSTKTTQDIAALQAQLRKEPAGGAERWTQLGRAFVRQARESCDSSYYAQADDAAGRALAVDETNLGAWQLRQLVLLNNHRFVEARAVAEQQLRRHPQDEVAWATLGDSALELGFYDGALTAYQKMMDIKPNLRSYNRGAWMRWLLGDGEGAIELMKLAIEAGSPRDLESLAYCRVQLGDLHFFQGHYDLARGEYAAALRDLPRYAPALAARGRLNLATGKINEAVVDLSTSLAIQPLTAVRALYVDALLAAGSPKEAEVAASQLQVEGVHEDPRALSLYYSNHAQQQPLALELAKEELRRRPDIWSLDAVAWALYRSGKLDEAWTIIQGATRLGTRDPRLLFHRGRIAAARHDSKEALGTLRAALAQSPSWDLHEPQEAREIVGQLAGLPSAQPSLETPGKQAIADGK